MTLPFLGFSFLFASASCSLYWSPLVDLGHLGLQACAEVRGPF